MCAGSDRIQLGFGQLRATWTTIEPQSRLGIRMKGLHAITATAWKVDHAGDVFSEGGTGSDGRTGCGRTKGKPGAGAHPPGRLLRAGACTRARPLSRARGRCRKIEGHRIPDRVRARASRLTDVGSSECEAWAAPPCSGTLTLRSSRACSAIAELPGAAAVDRGPPPPELALDGADSVFET